MFGAPHQTHVFFTVAHFKHMSTRYPMTTLLAVLVQRLTCSACHIRETQFLVFPISNAPTLSIQRHFCWHFWCRGMRIATPETRIFGNVHVSHNNTWHAMTVLFAFLVQRYARSPHLKDTPSGMGHFKRTHTEYAKIILLAFLC